jgi:transcriptional regulator with XRE-family HTH domain
MTKDIFSSRLREALDKSGLTQAQLGAAAGCGQEDISRYLQGRIPGGDRLILIANALGTSAEALVGQEKQPVEVIREAFRRANYDQAMAEMRKIRKSLEELRNITKSVAKLEAILGRNAGIRAPKKPVRRGRAPAKPKQPQ